MNKGFLLSLVAVFSVFTLNAQDVYWPEDISEINTGTNATYLIQSSNLDGNPIIFGYVLGAFYTNDEGNLQCGGFANCSSNTVGLAVMGDDTTTEEKDGFYDGEEITWLAYGVYTEQTYTATVSLSVGTVNYTTNGFANIAAFNVSSVILGCTDSTACNFNANATNDDSSCIYAQNNFDCEGNCIDTDGDTVCDIDEVLGCTDETACNYDISATEDDNTNCTYPTENYNCNNECLNDSDNDGICDEYEIDGCTDENACNYDFTATDLDNSCEYTTGCQSCEQSVIIDNDDDNDGICNADEITGCTDIDACNYNSVATDEDNTCTYATGECDSCSGETNGTGYIIDNDADDDGVCNEDEEGACVDNLACNYNSNPTFDEDNSLCVYATGNCDTCSGEEDGSGSVIDNDTDNDGVCNADEIEGCMDMEACNYNAAATEENNTCVLPVGCETCSGDQDGTGTVQTNDDDNDGICNSDEIEGCMDVEACNYNAAATDDNSTCVYLSELDYCNTCSGETDGTGTILANDDDNDGVCNADEIVGCTDITACNYNENATEEGECIFLDTSTECMICSGETDGTGIPILNDDDLDGICNEDEVFGCTDSLYTEYNPLASEDDESCLTLAVFGCLDNLAFNYANQANTSNESCIYDVTVNFETTSTNATTNYSVAIDTINLILGDSPITNGDIIGGFYINEGQLFCAGFTTWDGSDFSLNLWNDDSSTEEIDGLTENSTIYWIVQQEATMFNYLVDFTLLQATGVTFVSQISLNQTTSIGCMDPTAYNYNSNAFISDGACEDFIDGCLDVEACNFNENANTEDGSCYYISAMIPNFEVGTPLTVETDATNATYIWYLNGEEQDETTNEFTPYVNGEYMVIVTDYNDCSITATYNLENIGINEHLSNQVSLYPNPSTNYVEIKSTTTNIQSLKVISITGKLIQEYSVDALQFKIERNNIAKGIYFVQVTINNREITKQIVFE